MWSRKNEITELKKANEELTFERDFWISQSEFSIECLKKLREDDWFTVDGKQVNHRDFADWAITKLSNDAFKEMYRAIKKVMFE